MIIGACRVSLAITDAMTLKDRRQVVRRLKDSLRNSFNIAVAEVGELGRCRHAELGIVCVGNDQKYLNGILNRVVDRIELLAACEILDVEMEFF
jgi:hypothetical protein